MIPRLVVIVVQLQVTQADVPFIVDAVLEAIVPEDGSIGGPRGNVRIGDWTLLLDVQKTARSFQQLNPRLAPTFSGVKRLHVARGHADAITCAADNPRRCRIADDGIYVAVSNARLSTVRVDEYLLDVLVLWNTVGYQREVFIARVNNEWKVVRAGRATVI